MNYLTTTAGTMTEDELEQYLYAMSEDHGIDALVDWSLSTNDNLKAFYTIIAKQASDGSKG